MAALPWGHDALASDLARKLRNDGKVWTWLNATIGAWSGPRPDIMAFPRYRYDVPKIHAYEIKVQRSDLLCDLRTEKWRKYQEHCQTVTFAMPHGLATKDEIPAECGIMFRTGRGWRTERRAPDVGSACSIQAMAKLLTCHPTREPYPGLSKWEQDAESSFARSKFLQDAGEKYGRALASFAADIADGKDPSSEARLRADAIIEDAHAKADAIRKELAPILAEFGLTQNADEWAARIHLKKLRDNLDVDERCQKINRVLDLMEKSLADARGMFFQ